MKVTIAKSNALQENIQIELNLGKPDEWESKVRPAFQALDRRQLELNMRVLKVNKDMGRLNENEFNVLREILATFNQIILEDPKTVEAIQALPDADPENAL